MIEPRPLKGRERRLEKELIERRDAEGLWSLYRCRFPVGEESWCPEGYKDQEPSDDLGIYEPIKRLGAIVVRGHQLVPATGRGVLSDGREVFIRRGSMSAVMLHVSGRLDQRNPRNDLGRAALYIDEHPRLYLRPNVVGITYQELADSAKIFGFQQIELSGPDPSYAYNVRAAHMAFSALNLLRSGEDREFQLAMVCMPTREFVERFMPSTLIT